MGFPSHTPIEPGGTYVRSPSSDPPPPPPTLAEKYTPYIRYRLPLAIKSNQTNTQISTTPQIPPFPDKMYHYVF